MQKTIVVSCVLLVFALSSCAPIAQESASERQQHIAAIGYGSIDFIVPHSRFLEEFRGAIKVRHEDEAFGVSHYAIQGADNGIDVVGFVFLNDELMNLLFTYQEDRIAQLGGIDILKADAVERFGTPTEDNEIGTIWSFPTADRKVVAVLQGGMWTISIERTSVAMQLQAMKTQVAGGQSEREQSDQPSEAAGWVYWRPTAAERAEMEAEARQYARRHGNVNTDSSPAHNRGRVDHSLVQTLRNAWRKDNLRQQPRSTQAAAMAMMILTVETDVDDPADKVATLDYIESTIGSW